MSYKQCTSTGTLGVQDVTSLLKSDGGLVTQPRYERTKDLTPPYQSGLEGKVA